MARLRAEHDAATTQAARAVLLHEIGVLEERAGDEAASARDQLAAANAESDFVQPVESLVAIIERRQAYKNLGKLLDRLGQLAARAEERARARLDQAAYLSDQESDFAAAASLLEGAAMESPDDAGVWLALELVAGKLGDGELAARALGERARLAEPAGWRGLLLIDLAELRRELGDVDGAAQALGQAAGLGGAATFVATQALAELGRAAQRSELEIQALERQGELIFAAVSDPELAQASGVPRHACSVAHAVEAWLRGAEAARRLGDGARAGLLVERAFAAMPADPAVVHARLRAAELAADTAGAGRVARLELERGAKGPRAAALWLRVAEAAASEGDSAAALNAITRALDEDPAGIAPRALYLDLLGMGPDRAAFVTALEAAAEQLPSENTKANYYLISADIWARECRDPQGARAALSQAGMYGASPWLVARVARMLASLTDDGAWYDEATRRLLAQGAAESEQFSLWFELARLRAMRGEPAAAASALEGLSAAPGGGWLGNLFKAYVLELLPQGDAAQSSNASAAPPAKTPWEAVLALAEHESDAKTHRALRLSAALRALLHAAPEPALEQLRELHEEAPGDVLTGSALAGLELASGGAQRAAEVLARSGEAAEDAEVGATLALEAAIRQWQLGDRQAALAGFGAAELHAPRAARAAQAWALRAASPDDLDARRRALEAAHDTSPGLSALERFALEAGNQGDPEAAQAALDESAPEAAGDTLDALLLASALWGAGPRGEPARARALEALAERGGAALGIASASRYWLELSAGQDGHGAELADAARRWAQADGSLGSALEWLSAAQAARDVQAEVEARHTVADRTSYPARPALAASAALVRLLARQEVEPALDPDHPAARLANSELAAPGGDPRRRAHALLHLGELVGDDGGGVIAALAGYNQLAAGDTAGALDSFRHATRAHPGELMGWEGLRTAAEIAGDIGTLAEACAALGDVIQDPAQGARSWERAAQIYLDELKDAARGEAALTRAVARDVGHFSAFDRLFRRVRERKDGPRLLELIAARLEVAEDPEEIAKLFWERARVLRGLGDNDGALSALENVRMLEPDHVGALALSGEIYIRAQRFAEAAENLARLSALDQAPAQQRLMSGIAAVDLYENKLDDVYAALDVLSTLNRAGLGTQSVRERLARAAARAEAWEQATTVLEVLMNERASAEGRIEAARLGMVIYRDRLNLPARAEACLTRLLAESPGDDEALDLVLRDVLPREKSAPLLSHGLEACVEALVEDPSQPERVERVARIAAWLERPALRQAALGSLVALGVSSPATEQELSRLDQRVAHVPSIAIDETALPELCDPEDAGPVAELMRTLAPAICLALGPSLAAFGVGKRERVEPRTGLPLRNEVAAWAGALGIGEFELYVGGSDPDEIAAVASDTPALVVGTNVSAPLSARNRQAVARELFALRRGTSVLRYRDPAEIGALVVAACRIAEVEVESPPFAMLAEFQRQLGKEIPRRIRKLLPDLARVFAASHQDVPSWYRAATASLDRMAAIAAGDVSQVFARGRGGPGLDASQESRARLHRLLSFVLSPTYLELRERLGMGMR